MEKEVARIFDSVKCDTGQLERINNIREAATAFLMEIDGNIDNSREKSIAITKLEESTMWAIKAISHYIEPTYIEEKI